MSDIFKLIRANIERSRNPKEETYSSEKKTASNRMDLESFIIGEDEQKFQPAQKETKKKSIDLSEIQPLEQEIGSDFDSKSSLADIEYIDYVKLDKMPKDKQLRLMKREYLVLKDRISEITSDYTKTDKTFKEQSVEYHNLKKNIHKLKELIRIIGHSFPDGMVLKEKLEAPNWTIEDIEDELLSRLNFVINRAKNADVYLEQETAELTTQIQGLKNRLTKVENRNLELEQENEALKEQLEHAVFPNEDNYEDGFEDDDEDDFADNENTYNDDFDDEYDDDYKNDNNETDDFDNVYSQEYGDAFDDDEHDDDELSLTPKPLPAAEKPKKQQDKRNEQSSSKHLHNDESSSNSRTRQKEERPNRNDRSNNRTQEERPNRNDRSNNRNQEERPNRNDRSNNRNQEERPNRNDRSNNRNQEERPNRNDRSNNRNQEERPNRTNKKEEQPTNRIERPKTNKRPSTVESDTTNNQNKKTATGAKENSRPKNSKDAMPLEEFVANPAIEFDDTFDPNQIMDVDAYLESLTEPAKYIITVVGELGVSRNAELKDVLTEREEAKDLFFSGTKFQKNIMNNAVNDLINAQILTNNQINLGARGSTFKIYELEDLGKHMYFTLTNEVPVKSELARLVKQHASAEHGFLIKDSAEIFKSMGYTVYTERKDLRRDLEADNGVGKRKDFDLIIEKDGVKSYIEVERGTHTDEGFFKAMDKIRQITEEFYFICSNEDVLFNKTKRQFFMWIQKHLGGMDQARGIKANFTTFGKLKEGKNPIWENIEL